MNDFCFFVPFWIHLVVKNKATAKATTPGNLATGVKLDCVTFDLTGSTYTINEDEGTDEDVHGLRIIDFNTDTGEVEFMVKVEATLLGSAVTA